VPTSGGVVVPRVPTSGGLAGPRAPTSGKCAMQFFSSPCVFLNTSPANVGSLHLGRIPNCSEVPNIDVCRRVPTSGGRLRSRAPTCGLPHTNTTSDHGSVQAQRAGSKIYFSLKFSAVRCIGAFYNFGRFGGFSARFQVKGFCHHLSRGVGNTHFLDVMLLCGKSIMAQHDVLRF